MSFLSHYERKILRLLKRSVSNRCVYEQWSDAPR